MPVVLFLVAFLAIPESVEAQFLPPPAFTRLSTGPDTTRFRAPRPAAPRSGVAAFAIEALGGAGGSAAGFGIGVLLADAEACNNEDLQCILQDVALAMGGSAVGSALGAWGTGTLASTRPSILGAALGSMAGTVAGLGTVHLLEEELDLGIGDGAQLAGYVVTHGVVTAIGSRLIAALRR